MGRESQPPSGRQKSLCPGRATLRGPDGPRSSWVLLPGRSSRPLFGGRSGGEARPYQRSEQESKMYRRLEESSGNVLGYETRSKLTEEELGAILADMEEAIDRFGKVNLLVYVPVIPRQ